MRRFFFMLPLLLLAGTSGAAEPLATVIQKADDAFAAAFNKGDAAAIGQMYTADATILPAGATMMKGRDAIEKFWQGGIQGGLKNMTVTAVSVESYGRSTLREIGRFSFDTPGQGGQPTKAQGKYMVIWKKIGGKWLLDADIWNTDK